MFSVLPKQKQTWMNCTYVAIFLLSKWIAWLSAQKKKKNPGSPVLESLIRGLLETKVRMSPKYSRHNSSLSFYLHISQRRPTREDFNWWLSSHSQSIVFSAWMHVGLLFSGIHWGKLESAENTDTIALAKERASLGNLCGGCGRGDDSTVMVPDLVSSG